MTSLLTAIWLAACAPVIYPTAEMVKASQGKPDRHQLKDCGGGIDEFGKKIPKWKCLIWEYDERGRIYFSRGPTEPPPHPVYFVTGCHDGKPVVTRHEDPVWYLDSCQKKDLKEVGCGEAGLGVDSSDDWHSPPEAQDEFGRYNAAEWEAWTRDTMQVCTSQADAQSHAQLCRKAHEQPREPPPKTASDQVKPPLPFAKPEETKL